MLFTAKTIVNQKKTIYTSIFIYPVIWKFTINKPWVNKRKRGFRKRSIVQVIDEIVNRTTIVIVMCIHLYDHDDDSEDDNDEGNDFFFCDMFKRRKNFGKRYLRSKPLT